MRTKLFFSIFLAFNSLYAIAHVVENKIISSCLLCNIPTGLTISDLTGASATLSWNAMTGATKYSVEVEDEQNNPSNFKIETSVPNSTYALSGLTPGVLYKFKVRTHCGGEKSDWSDWVYFTAGTGGGGSGTCLSPGTLSASVNGGVATLSWNKVSGVTQYYIEVEDEQNVPSNFHLETAVQDTFFNLTGLQAGVSYKFKVRSHCSGGGQSDWSGWLFFNGNTGVGGFGSGSGNCMRPSNAQTSNITANAAILSWNAVQGVNAYTIEVELEQGGSAPWQITQVVSTNTYLLTGLNADTRYKFKVRSNCTGGGHSNWTKRHKFKTAPNVTDTPGSAILLQSTDYREASAPGKLEPTMKVWPNPVQTQVTVQLQQIGAGSTTLYLFDLSGHQIMEQINQTEQATLETVLNVHHLPNGLYYLKAQNGANTTTTKLVILHE